MFRAFHRALFIASALFTAGLFQAQQLSFSAHEARHAALHFQDQESGTPSLHDGDCGLCVAHRHSNANFQITNEGAFVLAPECVEAFATPQAPSSVFEISVPARAPPVLC